MAAKELAKGLKEGLKDLKPVTREILEQFGISSDNNFEGLIPLAVLLYPRAKELEQFLKNLLVIENQLMTYLDSLGADLSKAITSVQENQTAGFAFGGPKL